MKQLIQFLIFVIPVLLTSESRADFVGDSQLIRFKVEKFKLKNGLTVLLHEDRTVPLVSLQTWFRVGSKDEAKGLTGIAHLFEHMMFKGAKRYTGDQFDTILQANGAINNAFTTHDYTGYYENFPSSALELVMDIESDRMVNLSISQESLNSERDVVKEERRFRVENSPVGMIYERIYETLFKIAPYKWPVIGYMTDLDNVNPQNATDFYRAFYAPNNAVLVLAGDFDTQKAKGLIEKYYTPLQAQPLPERKLESEPEQKAPRASLMEKAIQAPYVSISYLAPAAGSSEAYAMDLLANIMGTGKASRLYRRMVHKEQISSSVSVWSSQHQLHGTFIIMSELKPGADISKAEDIIRREMWYPANKSVSLPELKAAKNQTIMSYVDGLKTIHGKARNLAYAEIIYGDYEQLFKDLDQYLKVTPEQIQAVAKKYLAKEKSSLVVLAPKSRTQKPAPQEAKQ